MNTAAAAAGGGYPPPFTASQWQELEHQALVFKYLLAGVPVPPELLLPIRRSLESTAARFYHQPASEHSLQLSLHKYHQPTMGYCSTDGKKVDPEPWRCRRTDGKKWRCSKESHPDSKYCERHMHRSRNSSRKPVEKQPILNQSKSSMSLASSTVTTLTPSGSSGSGSSTVGSFPFGIPLKSHGGSNSTAQVSFNGSSLKTLNRLHMDPVFYGTSSRDYRCMSEVDQHSSLSEASGKAKGVGIENSLDSTWRMMPSQASSYSPSEPRDGFLLQSSCTQRSLHDLVQESISSSSNQQRHYFFRSEVDPTKPMKQEGQPLRSFFDEWPKTRDLWPDLEEDGSNTTSFSTTQPSISVPMASSNFTSSSR